MDLKIDNIGIVGLGVTGSAVYKLSCERGLNVSIYNKTIVSGQFELDSEEAFKSLNKLDVLIISPGIDPNILLIKKAVSLGIKVIGEIEFSYLLLQNSKYKNIPIVAITGSNGKTTTVSLLQHLLKANNINCFVGGNIGRPFCEILFDEYNEDIELIILELSSFQLETCNLFKATIAALLNIYPTHQERYINLSDYTLTKLKIFNNVSDNHDCFIGKNISDEYVKINNKFIDDINELIPNFKLLGNHNLENLWFTKQIIKRIELKLKLKINFNSLDLFNGVKFRTEVLKISNSLVYINDSKSTNNDSSIVAIKSLLESSLPRPYILIIGGKIRSTFEVNKDLIKLAEENLDSVLSIGESGIDIAKSIENCCYKMDLDSIFKMNIKEGTILLSPGFPSFDQFENYIKRGQLFEELIKGSK